MQRGKEWVTGVIVKEVCPTSYVIRDRKGSEYKRYSFHVEKSEAKVEKEEKESSLKIVDVSRVRPSRVIRSPARYCD